MGVARRKWRGALVTHGRHMTRETSLHSRIVTLLRNVRKTQAQLCKGLGFPRGKASRIAWKTSGS